MVKKPKAKSKRNSKITRRIENLLKKIKGQFTVKNFETCICCLDRFLLWLFYDFSGIRFIWSKILPPKEKPVRKPSTFLFWVFGIYVALYGITSQRYENRIDIIENRANSIFAQLSTPAYKKALSRIARVQNMPCPKKPYILKPGTVFASLIGKEGRYDVIANLLKETIEDWKDKLGGINLSGVQLMGANFQFANIRLCNFQEAYLLRADFFSADLTGAYFGGADFRSALLEETNLQGANFAGAKGLTFDMLSKAKTLYNVKGLDPDLERELKDRKPELFEKPK